MLLFIELFLYSLLLLPDAVIIIATHRLACRRFHESFLMNRRRQFWAFPFYMVCVAAHGAGLCVLHYDLAAKRTLGPVIFLFASSSYPHPMSMTTGPPSGVAPIQDLVDCRAHGFELEDRLASQNLVEGVTAIDGGGHVDPAETGARVVRHRLVRVEIDEDWI